MPIKVKEILAQKTDAGFEQECKVFRDEASDLYPVLGGSTWRPGPRTC